MIRPIGESAWVVASTHVLVYRSFFYGETMAFDISSIEGSPVHDLDIPGKGDEANWASYVDEILAYSRGAKLAHEFHWREALLFLGDEQWISWNSTTQAFRRHGLDDWIPTPVTNYIQKIHDRLLDIMTAGDLMGQARASSSRADDIDRGKAASRVLRSLYQGLDTADTFDEAAAWCILTGNLILFSNYDTRAGKLVKIPQMDIREEQAYEDVAMNRMTGERHPADFAGQTMNGVELERENVEMMQDGKPVTNVTREHKKGENGEPLYDELYEGQVVERATNPFGFFPQPRSRWKDVDYAIEVEATTPDEVVSLFGSKWRGKIFAEDISLLGLGAYLTNQHGHGLMQNYYDATEFALLKFFRHRPSDKFPEGKYVCTIGGNLLYEGPIDTLKTKDGELPWELTQYRKIPGELWGHGPMRSAIPLQKRINSIDSAIIHNRKTMLNPRWMIPNRSGVRIIEGRPASIIRWDSHSLPRGIEPRPIPGIPLPPTITMEREQALRDLEDITGTLDVLSGRQPSGVDTLGQTEILLEQAAKRFAPMLKRVKRTFGRHEKHKLRLAQEHWALERSVKTIGEDSITEQFHYKGADFAGVEDVYIDMEASVNLSEAVEVQKIQIAYDKGILGDARNPEVRMKVLEKLKLSGFQNEFTIDAERARRSIHKIRDLGEPVEMGPFDVHPVHFKILTDYIKSADFEKDPKDVQESLMTLAGQYQKAMAQQAQQAQQAAMATKGAGPQAENAVVESGAFGGGQAPETMQ